MNFTPIPFLLDKFSSGTFNRFYKVRKTGHRKICRGIDMSWSETTIWLKASLEVSGNTATPQIAAFIEKNIKEFWSAKIEEYVLYCDANVVYRNDKENKVPDSSRASIFCNKKLKDPIEGNYYHDHVHASPNSWINGERNWWMCLQTGDVHDNFLKYPKIIAHEFAHLLGLNDRYIEIRNKRGKIIAYRDRPGWKNNIMNNSSFGILEAKNIRALLYIWALEPGVYYHEDKDPTIDYFEDYYKNYKSDSLTSPISSQMEELNQLRYRVFPPIPMKY